MILFDEDSVGKDVAKSCVAFSEIKEVASLLPALNLEPSIAYHIRCNFWGYRSQFWKGFFSSQSRYFIFFVVEGLLNSYPNTGSPQGVPQLQFLSKIMETLSKNQYSIYME